jgi:hypothetical protein
LNFNNQPYCREPEEEEEKTIAQLAVIHFGAPKDELERSLIEHEQCPKDQDKEELDKYFDKAPIV